MDRIFLLWGIRGVPPLLLFQLKLVVFSFYLGGEEILILFFAVISGVASFVYIRFVVLIDFMVVIWNSLVFFSLWGIVSFFLPVW